MKPQPEAEALAPVVEGLLFALVRRRLGDQEPSALSTTQQLALASVVDKGPIRLGVLASAVGTTDPTASRAVDVLENAGLVKRHPYPSDRRGITIVATPAGHQAIADARKRLVVMLTRLLDTMGHDSRDRFIELMHALRPLLRDDGLEPSDKM